MLRLFAGLVTALTLYSAPIWAHYDHGVGGERLRFEAFPEVEKPTGPHDSVLNFRRPPVIRVIDSSLDFDRGITIAAWVFRTGSASPDPVVSQVGDVPGLGSFALYADGSEGRGFVLRWVDGSITEVSGYVVPADRWVHLVATYDRVRATVYVDGELAATVEQHDRSIAQAPVPVLIGSAGVLETIPFSGKIDAVRIWQRGLSKREVEREHAGHFDGEPDTAWSFDLEDPRLQRFGSISLEHEAGRGKVASFHWEPRIRIQPVAPIDTQITVTAWVYNRGIQRQGGPILGRWGQSQAERSYVLYSVGGDGFGFRAFWRDGTQNNLTVVDTPMETWFHYAATYDGREMRLYINGVPAGRTFTVDKTFASSTAETWIGGVGTSTGEAFYGYLDDVGIWSRALSEEELKQVISGGPNRNDKTLSAWHSFEEESSSADELRASDIPSPTLEQAAAAGLDDHLKANAVGYGSDSTKVDRLFWWAVNHAHIRAAEILVSQGADVNARLGWGGHTALHAAVRDRRIEVIQFLIGQAANVNALDATYGSTPWEWAERFEYPILRSYLLDTAAESNVYAAVEHDTPDHVENLLKQPEPWDLNAVLRKAAQLGRPEILELLINAGADPKHVKDGTTPHDLAVLNSRYECVDILRRAEGRADSTDTDYIDLVQMLEEAIVQGQVREIARLVAVDPDLVRSDPQADRTWLQLAVEAGNAEVTRLLIHSGASLERVRNGHTALSWAATRGELSVGRLLVDSGAVVDLFTAAGLGDLGYVRDLFDGDVPALESSTGSTRFDNDRTPLPKPPVSSQDQISDALYVAARNGHANVVVYLLNKGGDPNFRAARGGTAVYWAVHSADIRTIEVLVKAGGDPSIPDRYGRNALQVAARSGYSEVKKLLGIKE